jgi:hypothetical protein
MAHSGKEKMQIEQTKDSESMLERLTAYAEACEKKGIFPYDGQWLSADEINNQIRRKHFKSRIHMLELGLLFAMVHVIAILSWKLISRFNY